RKEAISLKWYPEEEHQPDDLLRSDEQRYRVIRREKADVFGEDEVFGMTDISCSLSYTVDEIKTMVQKQIEEDKVRQLAMMNLAIEFENASIAKDNMRIAYDECSDIPQEKRVPIDTYLKQKSDKDYGMHNVLFRNATKIEHQMNNKMRQMCLF
nr:hypothetical protein [Tanacetum cinerariifolium]